MGCLPRAGPAGQEKTEECTNTHFNVDQVLMSQSCLLVPLLRIVFLTHLSRSTNRLCRSIQHRVQHIA